MIDKSKLKRGKPTVEEVREFLEIVRDFTDPRELFREALSNSLDWDANQIRITVTRDRKHPEEELVIEIYDDGLGLNEERLDAFFSLGKTTTLNNSGEPIPDKIGEKGHGTKTYFNSRSIEVDSDGAGCSVYAIMENPLQKLSKDEVPEYDYDIEKKQNSKTYTKIKIRHYNMSQNVGKFGHNVLKDYILWFTSFGSVEKEFEIFKKKDKVLHLQGLGQDTPENIDFGHRFPIPNDRISSLMEERPTDWTKIFVKKWCFKRRPIIDH